MRELLVCRTERSSPSREYLEKMKSILEPPNPSQSMEPTLEPPEFSLVLGGPLFRFCQRTHLSGEALELVHRQALIFTVITWLPLLLLSVLEGHAFDGTVRDPFLRDIEPNARFLVALPALIFGELVVHRRLTPLIRRFTERHIIANEDLPKFEAAVKSAQRLRDFVFLEAALVVGIYTVGLWVWRSEIALGDLTWYALPDGKHMNLTLAGY